MLTKPMIQEIQELKQQGYSIPEIRQYYEEHGAKPPSMPTIRKYYDMDAVPDEPNENLKKDKVFDHEPTRNAIIEIVTNNPRCYASSVYDVLTEKFIDSGELEALPGNEQTLRNYISYLKAIGAVDITPENRRIYDHVFDTPPGDQMLLDFGQINVGSGTTIHFICMLLRYSRMISVFAQDHKYNAEDACRAIYRGFAKLGGRPKQLVIDQDAVFISSETYGEVVTTQVFEDFLSEQGLTLWVCNKADPESKGPIENVVGYVKKNFFSARKNDIKCIYDVQRSLPGWVLRKNGRIHQSTYRVPKEVMDTVEKEALRPMIPSFYESSPLSYKGVEVRDSPYIQYKSSKYSVPRVYCFKTVHFKAVGNKIYIYDADMKYICEHQICECRGSTNQLPEHKKEESEDWILVMERLRNKWGCYDFQHFINGFKKEDPRHLSKQLSAVEKYLDAENPEREMVAEVMKSCCEKFRYKYSQFKAVYELVKAGYSQPAAIEMSDVQQQDLAKYGEVFHQRASEVLQ
jgi:hypothetical protein